LEPILVEHIKSHKTHLVVGKLFLTKEMSKIVSDELSKHYGIEDVREIVLSYYDVIREFGEPKYVPMIDDFIKTRPDRFILKPNHLAQHIELPDIEIELPSSGKDVCFVEWLKEE
jgi:hypothetical protein